MKKILLSSFAISGLFLLTGCSLTGTTVDNDSKLNEQISLLQQQMSGLNSEVQELKKQNDELIEENETIKINLSDQNSGASILLTQNEELKKDIEKYKQVLVQERLKNKSINENENNQNNTIVDNTKTSKEIGLIKQIYVDQNGNKKLEIDYIQLGGQDECGGGVTCIINENPQLRTFIITNNVEIIMQTLSHTSNGNFENNQSISFDYFKQKFNDTTSYNDYPYNYSNYLKAIPYWITIENNTITKIEEQYMP